ncbi:MAG: ammonium transporter [Spirochaetaceae bacterium]|nr:ammonium transporter [Spirochaetaceae bacterium]
MNLVDTGFVLICSALVFLMTPGLAFFYGGLVGRHNTLTIMAQNLISLGVVTVVWIVLGFSLAFGDSIGGIFGDLRYGLFKIEVDDVFPGTTIPTWTFFLFQMMFAVITPALITGAFVDRFRFSSYLIFISVWSIVVYSVLAHSVWGDGLLARLGAIDFAGGTVVHISAGMAALATIAVLGKRHTRTAPHDVRFVALGAALLWFGWFGFNGGSALSPNAIASIAFLNTDISASTAMVVWMLMSWLHKGKPSIIGALTGAIAGLIAITPAAGFVTPGSAAIIGVLAGAVCYGAVLFKERMDWDDALDVWAVHGVGGVLGSILTGVFASPKTGAPPGLIFGETGLFFANLGATVISMIYAFAMTWIVLKVIGWIKRLKPETDELEAGLDLTFHGERALDHD